MSDIFDQLDAQQAAADPAGLGTEVPVVQPGGSTTTTAPSTNFSAAVPQAPDTTGASPGDIFTRLDAQAQGNGLSVDPWNGSPNKNIVSVLPPTDSAISNIKNKVWNRITDIDAYGVPQMYNQAMHLITGNPAYDEKANEYALATAQRQQQEAAYNGKPGDFLGGLATNALLSPAPVQGGFVGQVLGQGEEQFVQPTAPGQSRWANAGLAGGSAALGAGIPFLAKAGIQPFYAPASSAVTALKNEAIPLDTAQATGSSLAGGLKRYTVDAPWGGHSNFDSQVQAPAVTDAILSRFAPGGVAPTGKATDIAGIEQGYTDTMNQVYGRNPIDITNKAPITTPQTLYGNKTVPQPNVAPGSGGSIPINSSANPIAPLSLNRGLDVLWDRASREISSPNGGDPLKNIITNLRSNARANSGVIPVDVLQSAMGEISGLSQLPNPKLPELGGQLKELLNTALAKQETVPGDAAALQEATQKYSALQDVKKAFVKNYRKGSTEDIGLPQLHQIYSSPSNAGNLISGSNNPVTSDLTGLSAAGQEVLPEKIGNSGTATRLLLPAMFGLGAGGLSELMHGSPGKMALAAGAGLAAPLYGRYALYGGLPRATANNSFINSLIRGGLAGGTAAGNTVGQKVVGY